MTKSLNQPFIRIAVAAYDDPDLESLSDKAFRLYFLALAYAKDKRTDGYLSEVAIRQLMRRIGANQRTKSALTEPKPSAKTGETFAFWEQNGRGTRIRNWAKFQQTLAEEDEEREKRRAAGLIGNQRRWGEKESRGDGPVTAATVADAITPAIASAIPPAIPPAIAMRSKTLDVRQETLDKDVHIDPTGLTPPGVVERVFNAWAQSTKRRGARLDDKRRRLIRLRLKDFPEEDLVAAVKGWEKSPHHRGENDRHTVYNDLELLLRDTAHVERFRDYEKGVIAPEKRPDDDMFSRWAKRGGSK